MPNNELCYRPSRFNYFGYSNEKLRCTEMLHAHYLPKKVHVIWEFQLPSYSS